MLISGAFSTRQVIEPKSSPFADRRTADPPRRTQSERTSDESRERTSAAVLSSGTQSPTRDAVQEAGVLHLFPGLVAPLHVLRGIGIVLVRRRIVVPRHRRQLHPGWD